MRYGFFYKKDYSFNKRNIDLIVNKWYNIFK